MRILRSIIGAASLAAMAVLVAVGSSDGEPAAVMPETSEASGVPADPAMRHAALERNAVHFLALWHAASR